MKPEIGEGLVNELFERTRRHPSVAIVALGIALAGHAVAGTLTKTEAPVAASLPPLEMEFLEPEPLPTPEPPVPPLPPMFPPDPPPQAARVIAATARTTLRQGACIMGRNLNVKPPAIEGAAGSKSACPSATVPVDASNADSNHLIAPRG